MDNTTNATLLAEAAKPGYKTTELYIAVLSTVLTFLAIRGVISVSDINPLLNAFAAIYGGAVGALTIYSIFHKYFQGRTNLKLKLLDYLATQPTPNLPIDNTVKTVQ